MDVLRKDLQLKIDDYGEDGVAEISDLEVFLGDDGLFRGKFFRSQQGFCIV